MSFRVKLELIIVLTFLGLSPLEWFANRISFSGYHLSSPISFLIFPYIHYTIFIVMWKFSYFLYFLYKIIYNKIGNNNSIRYGFARECFNKPFSLSKVKWFIFVYIATYLSRSYTVLTSMQSLMLKISAP